MADFTTTISGWNAWRYLATKINGVEKTDAPFPPLYTPAKAFWAQALIDHCAINWLVPIDTLTAFFLGGGTSFTLTGSLGGVSVVNELADLPSIGEFGWNLGSEIEIQVPSFKDINKLNIEIKKKVSELRSLQQYKFKSFIIEIQKKRLNKELEILRKQYNELNSNH